MNCSIEGPLSKYRMNVYSQFPFGMITLGEPYCPDIFYNDINHNYNSNINMVINYDQINIYKIIGSIYVNIDWQNLPLKLLMIT